MEDNGIGISLSDLHRVFDKGFTGQNGRKNEKATGMGLYLCKLLCDKLYLVLLFPVVFCDRWMILNVSSILCSQQKKVSFPWLYNPFLMSYCVHKTTPDPGIFLSAWIAMFLQVVNCNTHMIIHETLYLVQFFFYAFGDRILIIRNYEFSCRQRRFDFMHPHFDIIAVLFFVSSSSQL